MQVCMFSLLENYGQDKQFMSIPFQYMLLEHIAYDMQVRNLCALEVCLHD